MAAKKKAAVNTDLPDTGEVEILLYGVKPKTVDAATAKRLIEKGSATLKA